CAAADDRDEDALRARTSPAPRADRGARWRSARSLRCCRWSRRSPAHRRRARLITAMKHMAKELGPANIRVNHVGFALQAASEDRARVSASAHRHRRTACPVMWMARRGVSAECPRSSPDPRPRSGLEAEDPRRVAAGDGGALPGANVLELTIQRLGT